MSTNSPTRACRSDSLRHRRRGSGSEGVDWGCGREHRASIVESLASSPNNHREVIEGGPAHAVGCEHPSRGARTSGPRDESRLNADTDCAKSDSSAQDAIHTTGLCSDSTGLEHCGTKTCRYAVGSIARRLTPSVYATDGYALLARLRRAGGAGGALAPGSRGLG